MRSASRASSPATMIVVAILVLLAMGSSLLGTRESVGMGDAFVFDPGAHPTGTATVTSKSEEGGFSFLGIGITEPEYHVDVSFTVAAACSIGSHETWPVDDPACSGPARLAGPISGSGRTATGETIVAVAVSIPADCYAMVALGMRWPLPTEACDARQAAQG